MRITKIVLLLVAGIIFVTLLFIPNIFYGQKEELVQKVVAPSLTSSPTTKISTENKEVFLNDLSNFISGQEAKFGIEILELSTGDRFGINQDQKFHAASTSKVLVAAYALKKVDEQKLDLNQSMGDFSLGEQLRLMVNISDNDSWEILLEALGFSQIQNFSEEQGLLDSDIYQNTTSARDLNTLLAKLYKKEILSPQSTNLLFSWMQNTEREDLIPEAIPKNIQIYHKAGSLEGEIHDTAIIVNPRNPFILTVLSNGLEERSEIIREITRKVYQFEG